jgi:long-chain acyl-CoA synthetase
MACPECCTAALTQGCAAGNSFESCLVAVVVPAKDELVAWAKAADLPTDDFAALCATPEAQAHILSELKAQAKESKLRGFEVVKAVHLDTEEFNIEHDLITPTFKLRRPQLLAYYKDKVDAMYHNLKTA